MDLHSPLLDTEGGVAVLGGSGGSGVHAGGSVSSGTPTQTRKPGLGLLSPAALANSFTAQFSSSPFSSSSSSSNNASTQDNNSTIISSCQWMKILPADCNTVSNALSLPSERVKHCACFYKKSLYVFSGKNGNTALRDLWRFDLSARTWERLKASTRTEPRGVLDATMVASRGHLYIFGGELGWKNPEETSVWIFNLESSTWTQWQPAAGSPGPTNRRCHSAVVYHSGLFIYGGYIDLRGSSGQLWQFNMKSPSWRCVQDGAAPSSGSSSSTTNSGSSSSYSILGGQLSSCSSPAPRHDHSAIVYNHSMWVYGGISNLNLLNDLWVWNFEVTQWSQVWSGSGGRSVPRERYGHSASLVGYGQTRAMMIVGGQQAQGSVSTETWTFSFVTRQWSRVSPSGGTIGRSSGASHTPLPRTGHVTVQSVGNAEEEEETLPKRSISVPAMSQRPGSRRTPLSSNGAAASPQLAGQKTSKSGTESPSHAAAAAAGENTGSRKAKSPTEKNPNAPIFSFPPVDVFTANSDAKSWNKFAAGMNASPATQDSGTTVELIRLNVGGQSQSMESLSGVGPMEGIEETPNATQHPKAPLIPPPTKTQASSHGLKRQTSGGRRERRSKSREGFVSRKSISSAGSAGLSQPNQGWSSNVFCLKGGEGFGKLQNHIIADAEKKAGFRNPAFMVDKDAETGERSSTESRPSHSVANDASTSGGKNDASSSNSNKDAPSPVSKHSQNKLNTDVVNDLNLLADMKIAEATQEVPLISLDQAPEERKPRAPVSHCGSLEPVLTHPLMAAHGEERAMRSDVLKPTSVAHQNLKPRQNNVNSNANNSANNVNNSGSVSNAKSKPPSSMNNFSIPGQVQRSGRNSISSDEDNTCVPFEEEDTKGPRESRKDNLSLFPTTTTSTTTSTTLANLNTPKIPSPNFYTTDLVKGTQTKLLTRSSTGSSLSPSVASSGRPFSAGDDSLFLFDVDSSHNSDFSQYLPKENPFLSCGTATAVSAVMTTPHTSSSLSAATTTSSSSAATTTTSSSSALMTLTPALVPASSRPESATPSIRPKTGDSGFHDDGVSLSTWDDEESKSGTPNPFDPKLLQLAASKEEEVKVSKEYGDEEEEEEEEMVDSSGGPASGFGDGGEEWVEMTLGPGKSKSHRGKSKTVFYLFGGRQGDASRSISFSPLQLWRCEVDP